MEELTHARTPNLSLLRQDARVRPKSLYLPDGVSLEKWRQIGTQLAAIVEGSAWWLGDWLVYGERSFPNRYREAISETGLDYQTLRNYAWVARRFKLSRRRESLSFQHHAEVVALSDEEQDDWLDRAERLSWSRNRLRQYIRASRAVGRGNPRVVVRLETEEERHAVWRLAAERLGTSFEEWVAQVLDQAAGADLGDDAAQEGR